MNKKFFIAWLVIFIIYMVGGIVIHGVMLNDDYLATGLMRPEEEQKGLMVWMILAHVMMAGAFTWIYARGVEKKPWMGQGLRFGLAVALLAVVPIYIIYYVVQPLPLELVVKQIVFDTILTLMLGYFVALLYRDQAQG